MTTPERIAVLASTRTPLTSLMTTTDDSHHRCPPGQAGRDTQKGTPP